MLQNKTVSKFFRLKLSDALRSLLESLPIKNFEEIQGGGHVYHGKGLLKWGKSYRKSEISVKIIQGKVKAIIQHRDGSIIFPYNNKKERDTAIKEIHKKLNLDWW